MTMVFAIAFLAVMSPMICWVGAIYIRAAKTAFQMWVEDEKSRND